MRTFITGISRGIGKALVEQLLNEGHEVWGVSRSNIETRYPKFHHSFCDVRNESEVKRVAQQMKDAGYYPDVAVLNAGIEKPDIEGGFQYDVGKEIMEVNYLGAVKWVHELLRFPRKPSQFVAISSIFAFRPNDYSIAYSASKSALAMTFRGIRLQIPKSESLFKIVYLVAVNTAIKESFAQYVSGRKKSPFFVVSPSSAAKFIVRCLKSSKEDFYSHPWLSLGIRLTMFLPDRWFRALSAPFRRE